MLNRVRESFGLDVVYTLEKVSVDRKFTFRFMSVSKPEYEELKVPFILDIYTNPDEERKLGSISIEARATVLGEVKYIYACFCLKDQRLYENGGYEEMLESLKNSCGKLIGIRCQYKKNKLKKFEILLDSLSALYNDERFLEMECIGWGINEKSCREK